MDSLGHTGMGLLPVEKCETFISRNTVATVEHVVRNLIPLRFLFLKVNGITRKATLVEKLRQPVGK